LFTKLRGALFFLIENYVSKNIGFDVVFLKVANFHTMTTIKNTMQLTQRIAFGKN
jgi:hypothetical protein